MKLEELQELVGEGLSQRKIADRFGCSQASVRYWLAQTHTRNRYEGKYVDKVCNTHGLVEFIWEESRLAYRCKTCRSGRVAQERKELKHWALLLLGGKCSRCGYDRCFRALAFIILTPLIKSTT